MRYSGFENVLHWISAIELTEAQEHHNCEAPVGLGVPGTRSAVEELLQRAVECDVSVTTRSADSVVRRQGR